MQLEIFFIIVALIFSVVIHEVAHGWAANALGDPTARLQGRLTLNPLPHLDLFGSIIIPGLLVLTSSPFLFGYAKPVPYNPYNLKNQKWGEALVAFAGPGVNILLALLLGAILHFGSWLGFSPAMYELGATIIYINVLLAVINLIPIPPLDGSKVIMPFLPLSLRQSYSRLRDTLEMNPFIAFGIILVIVFVFGGPLFTLISNITSLIIGGIVAF